MTSFLVTFMSTSSQTLAASAPVGAIPLFGAGATQAARNVARVFEKMSHALPSLGGPAPALSDAGYGLSFARDSLGTVNAMM